MLGALTPTLASATVCCCWNSTVMPTMQCYDDPQECAFINDCGGTPPPPTPPLLPVAWHANLTVERGGKIEYRGWIVSSSAQCAARTVELGSPTGNHTSIHYYHSGAQCTFTSASAGECARGTLPGGPSPCLWGPDFLQNFTFDRMSDFGTQDPRSC